MAPPEAKREYNTNNGLEWRWRRPVGSNLGLSLAEGQRLAHMGSWAFDFDGFDYWSPELFRMHGLDPAGKGLTVQEYLDCVHPQHREAMANLIQGILAKPSAFDTTKRIVRPKETDSASREEVFHFD
jgi:hypothetical protein